MADRTASLEELQKITGYGSIEALESCGSIDLKSKNLTSLPLGVCDLTGLLQLELSDNKLSSLPQKYLD